MSSCIYVPTHEFVRECLLGLLDTERSIDDALLIRPDPLHSKFPVDWGEEARLGGRVGNKDEEQDTDKYRQDTQDDIN